MWRAQPTPFDRNPSELPLIRLLLHSSSLAQAVTAGERHVQALLRLGDFDLADVLLTPARDPYTSSALADAGVEAAVVERANDYWVLSAPEYQQGIGPVQPNIDYSAPIVPGSLVTWLDYIMARNLDYDWFVVDPADPFLQSRVRKDQDLSPAEALNRVRILTTRKGLLLATPHLRVNEGFYYLYRKRVIFPDFHRAWPYAAYSAVSPELSDQLGSLGQRLEFLLRAADQISYYALKRANNDTEDLILYHLAYLVMLTTGIFDDLAWILNFLYSLQLSPMKIVLKKAAGKANSPLLNALASKNTALHAYLTGVRVQDSILMFYPLRDRLQHRQFVTGGLVIHHRSTPRILVGVDAEVYSRLPSISSAGPKKHWGTARRSDEEWIDPHWFATTTVDAVAEIVSGVLSRIDWQRFSVELSPEQKEKLEQSVAHDPQNAGRVLGWGVEPVYFWAR